MAITVKHSFNSGDLISALPGFQKISKEEGVKVEIYQRLNFKALYYENASHPIKDKDGTQVCMNQKMFDMLRPLLESQPYIEKFEVWKGQETRFDIDNTRLHNQMPLQGGPIHYFPFLIYPRLECDLSNQWIFVDENESHKKFIGNKIIINRTSRYNNPYIDFFFLKDYQDKVVFSGTKEEHIDFCSQYELNIPYLFVENFKELASYIYHCRFFMGGQSMCWHIADAMKSKRILEICHVFPNTFPTGANGSAFLTQPHLEIKFNQFLKDTE